MIQLISYRVNFFLHLYHVFSFIKYLFRSFCLAIDIFFTSSSIPFKLLYAIAESLPNKFLLSFLLNSNFFSSCSYSSLSAEFHLANSYIHTPLRYLDYLEHFKELQSSTLPNFVIFGFYHQNFGHLSHIDLYARARSIGLEVRPFFFLKNSRSIANNELLNIISSSYQIPVLDTSRISFAELNTRFSDSLANIYDLRLSHYHASDFYSGCNHIYDLTFDHKPLAHLTDDQVIRALNCLNDNSISLTKRFVVLHVRSSRTTSFYRSGADACLYDYISTILYLVRQDFNVFLLDSSSNHNQDLLDLLPTEHVFFSHDLLECSPVVDIYLLSHCVFMIGTASGPLTVPPMFGRPVLYTNCPSIGHMFRLPLSRCIPQTFYFKSRPNKVLHLSDLLASSAAYTVSPFLTNLCRRPNPSDLILSSTIEFTQDLASLGTYYAPSSLQSKYLSILLEHHPQPSMTGLLPTNSFLQYYPELLG